jgi:hypothetical protein
VVSCKIANGLDCPNDYKINGSSHLKKNFFVAAKHCQSLRINFTSCGGGINRQEISGFGVFLWGEPHHF